MNFLERTKNKVSRSFFVDLSTDYRDTILLAGSGRSGTTWVSDIMNYDNEYRYIFEPFHPRKVDFSKEFGHRKYMHPEKI